VIRFDVITLFPELVDSPFQHSLMGRAREQGLLQLSTHFLREYAEGRHRVCDDTPFGGGEGMVMKLEPLARAIRAVRRPELRSRVLLTTPSGRRFDQAMARELLELDQLVLICGHYEGVDARLGALIDGEVSIGDFVLTGGELAACVIVETVARLIPGVVGRPESIENESFEDGILDFPQYTRPREFEGLVVPEILLSGDHARIAAWRREQALQRTLERRPELLDSAPLSDADRRTLDRLQGRPDKGEPPRRKRRSRLPKAAPDCES
jgi:tRNA (guanine37-N1)-methyltransferase